MYLGEILLYVDKGYPDDYPDTFYLRHTDLRASNVIIDPTNGSITGVIHWEFVSTSPLKLLKTIPSFYISASLSTTSRMSLTIHFRSSTTGARITQNSLRMTLEMKEYLRNVDNTIMFEEILWDDDKTTIEYLIEWLNLS